MAHTLNRTATLVFVTALISLVIANGALFAQIPPEEREALIALYEATDGDNWNWQHRSTWLGPPGTEGEWYGIAVENGHVVGIHLSGFAALRGVLPPEIGNLRHLRTMYFGPFGLQATIFRNIIESIPEEIGRLTLLEELDLGSCGLQNLPATIGNLRNLRVLNLGGNQIPLLPSSIGKLHQLERLTLTGNEISEIPPEIGNLSALVRLELAGCPLIGLPSEIGNLSNLERLSLGSLELSELPSAIGSLSNLSILIVVSSTIDQLPASIGNLTQLTELNLRGNQLTALPPEIGNLSRLEVLEVEGNRLRTLPPDIGNLSNLEILQLEENELEALPPEIAQLKIQDLDLTDNRLDTLPAELEGMSQLERILIDRNQFTVLPDVLGRIPNLKTISARENMMDSINSSIAETSSLSSLNLSNNKLEVLPYLLGQITTLRSLSADSNRIHTIEEGALDLIDLRFLSLQDNELTEFPLEVTEKPDMIRLDLSHNRLEGPVPAGLSNFTQIDQLDLSSNRLSGELPVELKVLYDRHRYPQGPAISLRWNALTVQDEELKELLESRLGGNDFSTFQTIPPEDLEVAEISGTAVELTWTPIPFSEGPGGYEVLVSTQPGGSFQSFGRTKHKHASSITVSNLETDTTYYFRVRTVSEPNENNKNEVISETGAEVSATTLPFTYFYYPLIMTGSESYTGFAASNLSGSDTELVFEGYGPDGLPFEAAFNPAGFALEDRTQLARLGSEIFGTDQIPAGSWLELKSGKAKLGSFFQIGSQSALDGGVPFTAPPRKRFYFTRAIGAQDLFENLPVSVLISLVNPTDERIEVELILVSNQREFLVGTKAETVVRTLPPRGSFLESVDELFGDHGFPSGFIRVDVTEGEGAFGFSLLEIDGGKTLVGLNPVDETTALELFSAQIASAPDIFTNLKLINTTGAERQVQLTLLSEEGEPIADPKTLSFSSIYRFLESNIRDLFDLPPGLSIGSLRVEADGPGVIGDVLFGAPSTLDYAAAALLQAETFQEAVFSHVARSSEIFTGLALFNPTAETAEITIEEFSAAGNLVGSAVIELPAGQRRAALLSELMPDAPGNIGGFLTIRSNQPLVAQQLFGGHTLQFLSSVPPTIFR